MFRNRLILAALALVAIVPPVGGAAVATRTRPARSTRPPPPARVRTGRRSSRVDPASTRSPARPPRPAGPPPGPQPAGAATLCLLGQRARVECLFPRSGKHG